MSDLLDALDRYLGPVGEDAPQRAQRHLEALREAVEAGEDAPAERIAALYYGAGWVVVGGVYGLHRTRARARWFLADQRLLDDLHRRRGGTGAFDDGLRSRRRKSRVEVVERPAVSSLTVTEASRVLDLSGRRVRDYVRDGLLDVVQTSPTRVSAASVEALRVRRRDKAESAAAAYATTQTAEKLLAALRWEREARYAAEREVERLRAELVRLVESVSIPA